MADTATIQGRWDITIDMGGKETPSWLEVDHSGTHRLIGYYVGPSGSARPISKVNFSDGKMTFSIPPQWKEDNHDITALIIGLLTPVVAIVLILDMLGAFFIVHAGSGVFVADGGYELVLALGIGLLLVAVFGAGRFSADAILKLPGARATATVR